MAQRFDILDYTDGTFGVLLHDYDPAADELATAAHFDTREEAKAFIAKLAKPTEKLVMYPHGKPFGVVLSDEECAALSADELREATNNYIHCVVRCPDGRFEMIAYDDYENWDFVDAVVTHHQDGSFEVVEIVQRRKLERSAGAAEVAP